MEPYVSRQWWRKRHRLLDDSKKHYSLRCGVLTLYFVDGQEESVHVCVEILRNSIRFDLSFRAARERKEPIHVNHWKVRLSAVYKSVSCDGFTKDRSASALPTPVSVVLCWMCVCDRLRLGTKGRMCVRIPEALNQLSSGYVHVVHLSITYYRPLYCCPQTNRTPDYK